jgi:hypothetical protein
MKELNFSFVKYLKCSRLTAIVHGFDEETQGKAATCKT